MLQFEGNLTTPLNSYQSSVEKFQQNGHTATEASDLMRRAVRLTAEAIPPSSSAKAVLSLSCYGSMCSPGQEYAGRYPAPYGPSGSPGSEKALIDWHHNRMLVFASDSDTWSGIEYIAIETLPLLSEGVAVRKAMRKLRRTLQAKGEHHWPNWWASFVFPDGVCPEGEDLDAERVASEMLQPLADAEVPTGLGINCTKLRFLPGLIAGYSTATEKLQSGEAPWLVLYPDGGLVYDAVTRTWHADASGADGKDANPAAVWASQLQRITSSALEKRRPDGSPVWAKAVVGGCCKASPDYIRELANVVKAP